MIIELISSIHKFLGYLEISPKYLNRAYTIISIFPTLYMLRMVYGMFSNENYLQAYSYLLLFLVFTYFIILNIFYYFFDKNFKWDITQLLVKYLPDEAFSIQNTDSENKIEMNKEKYPVILLSDSQLFLEKNINKLIESNELKTNELKTNDTTKGYIIPKHTLYPYYNIKKTSSNYIVQIGTDYSNLVDVGVINTTDNLEPIGLFISGGYFYEKGVKYKEKYSLKLIVKDTENSDTKIEQGTRSARHSKGE